MVVNWLIFTVIIFGLSYILPGVSIDSFWTALWVALVLGVINTFVRPIIALITLPINVLTLGLFSLVINTLLLMLVANMVTGFIFTSFWHALLFSICLALVQQVIDSIKNDSW